MKVLIAGQAKSGTTALYYTLMQSLPSDFICLFEPKEYKESKKNEFVLAKILINDSVNLMDFDSFQKKLLIVRDPRDNIVSRLLYAAYNLKFSEDDDKFRLFIERLEQKQKSPASVALIDLLNLLSDLSGINMFEKFIFRYKMALDFDALHTNFFVYKYEHFVLGQFSELEKYLSIDLNFNGNVDLVHSRVVRTKGAGDWRNWFIEKDINIFRGIYHDYLLKYGYDTEWKLNLSPKITSEHSTEYVKRLIRERPTE